jgi:general secretion pathway protein D
MKTTTLVLILFLTGLELWAQTPPAPNLSPSPRRRPMRLNGVTNNAAAALSAPTNVPSSGTPGAGVPAAGASSASPLAAPGAAAEAKAGQPPEKEIPAYSYNFEGVDVNQVLEVYAQLVGRTLLRATLPGAQIVLKTQTPLTRSEAIQALQAVLALNGISLVNIGEKFVKVLPSSDANGAGGAFDNSSMTNLPDLGSYVTHIVQLKYLKPSEVVPVIQPFAKLNSIISIDANGVLVIRDYAENVKRMLEMIQQVDVSIPAEYISEVIPIKYAMAEDIASALNTLGGSGGSTVSFGGSAATPSINGVARPGGTAGGGMGGMGGMGGTTGAGGYQGVNQPNQQRGLGSQTTPGGAPAGGTSFQQRLQSIIQRASSPGGQQDQIQVFGQTKIIADQRSNSLLIFATRADMDRIKAVIEKLDVLLAQVLIESVIMGVDLNSAWNLSVSAAQSPQNVAPSVPVIIGGGMNNGKVPFMHFIQNFITNYSTIGTNTLISGISRGGISGAGTGGTNSIFGNNLGSGLSYFGSIGPNWDVAISAAASDNTTTVIQRPRIQTSQAKAASFFVGQTVPYVTGSTYGSAYGNSSSYSQLSVGIELDVTPFINPDGLVVMDIMQEIDDISGYTVIDGNPVPNTNKRTLNSEIAVRDRDTIILGGFVRSDKSKSKSGVPLLMDIPLLGNLFTSRNDTKDRQETIVMIRPTVLKTPELAAAQAVKEAQRLPGISAAAAEDAASERKAVEAERKAELKRAKAKGNNDGFYAPVPVNASTDPNPVAPQRQFNGFSTPAPSGASADTNTVVPLNP